MAETKEGKTTINVKAAEDVSPSSPLSSSDSKAKNSSTAQKKTAPWLKRHWRVAFSIVVIIGVVWLAKGYLDTRSQLKKLSNPKAATLNETQDLTTAIGHSVELPTGETPTLATVSDISRLKGQEFFKDAENGDKVLIYTKAGKAILYRPSTKKIIEAAPINLNSTTAP